MSEPKDSPFISETKVQQIDFGEPDSAPGSPNPPITGNSNSPSKFLMGLGKIRDGIDLIAEEMAPKESQIPTTPNLTEWKSDALNQHRASSEKEIPRSAGIFKPSDPVPSFERPRRGPDDQPHQQQSKQNESLLHQAKLLVERFEQLAASNERNSDVITKLTEKFGDLKTDSASFDGLQEFLDQNFRALHGRARELVDEKPAFAVLIHLYHSSKSDNNTSVWQGITIKAQDRPFKVRVLMQNIQTAISNLHPDKPTKVIELTEVFFVWDDNVKENHQDFSTFENNRILGRGEDGGSIQEDEFVNNSLEAMMARGRGYIHVKYRLDEVEQAKWGGRESE